jgi:GlpG protein
MWIMLASALAASIANAVLLHTAVVGASGVVFTFILLSSITGLKEGELPLTFLLVAALYFGQQIYGALFVRDNVSYLGHIAGGAVGAVVGFLIPPKENAAPSGFGLG